MENQASAFCRLHRSIITSGATPPAENVASSGLGRSSHVTIFEPLVFIQSMNRKQATPCQRLRNTGWKGFSW